MQGSAQLIHRERTLLLIAAAFFLVGAVTLALGAEVDIVGPWSIAIPAYVACFGVAHLVLDRILPRRDPLLLPACALLTGCGLLLIGRLAINFLLRQTIWLLISTAALLAVVWLSRELRWLRRFRYTWLLLGLALLAATLVFGVNPSGFGQRLWLGIWGIYFQPSEALKLLMIVFLASYLAERRELLVSETWRVGRWDLPPIAYVGPLLAMLGLAMLMLGWQQDLGAAMLFFFTFLAMLYVATGQWGYVVAGLALFLIIGLAGYRLSPRVALRVDGWLNPWPEAADRTFQIVQSLLAFGAGGILGQGLGMGSPTFIPAVHTDFVFAAIGEEFGLAGTLAIVALYALIMERGFRAAVRATQPFERFLAAGLTAGWIIQAWVIMAGNARLAPISGVTLPFLSYGGSSLLTSFVALALLLRISAKPASAPPNQPANPLSPQPILHLAAALGLALALVAAISGYWSVARAQALRARDDDPRRVLYEQRIVRGRILDRDGEILAETEIADDGIAIRRYPLLEAAPAVGYASLRYGTGGIEAAFDETLRGEANRSAWETALAEMMHSPPHGGDVQLTLDATLQAQAQEALAGHAGAAVLLDASTGEVLALASSPTFDAETLDSEWEALREDPAAPLVNRATQGLFQPGAALQTAVVAEALERELAELSAPATNPTATISINGTQLGCHQILTGSTTLAQAYAAACPAPVAELGTQLGSDRLEQAVLRWALTTPPPLEIPTEAGEWDSEPSAGTSAVRNEAIGQGQLTVSPLQMALVAATLANDGTMPAPRLVQRARAYGGGWYETPATGEPQEVLAPSDARKLGQAWQRFDGDVAGHWGIAVSGKEQPAHAWFIGMGPASGGSRHAIAVLLEHAADPEAAVHIGTELLEAATAR